MQFQQTCQFQESRRNKHLDELNKDGACHTCYIMAIQRLYWLNRPKPTTCVKCGTAIKKGDTQVSFGPVARINEDGLAEPQYCDVNDYCKPCGAYVMAILQKHNEEDKWKK